MPKTIERFGGKTSFIDRLYLPVKTLAEIKTYHMEKNGITVEDRIDYRLLDTYSDLLQIARTLYYDDEEMKKYGIERYSNRTFFIDAGPETYLIRYKPQGLKSETWDVFVQAAADGGFLKPFFNDRRLTIWPELDYCFNTIKEKYADHELDLEDQDVIGCFCRQRHEDYESFDRILCFNDICRLIIYFRSIDMIDMGRYLNNVLYDWQGDEDPRAGTLVEKILDNKNISRYLGRTKVMNVINKIYLGLPVVVYI